MIIDTSAVIVLLRDEAEAPEFTDAITSAPRTALSAASYLEAGVVTDGARDPVLSRRLDEILTAFGVEIEPVTVKQVRIARAAYRDFGRGSGHPARLNFGDCFSYALAVAADEPLLFKGDDFARTDVRSALTRGA